MGLISKWDENYIIVRMEWLGAGGVVSHSGGGPHNFGVWMRPECFLSQIHQGSDVEDTHPLIDSPLLPTFLSGCDHTDF